MIRNITRTLSMMAGFALAAGIFAANASAQEPFRLLSNTISNGAPPPLSAILNNQVNGVNTCTANGAAGYDESPQLYWTGVPRGTRYFAVVLYDATASFTHWGMYNINGNVTELPENAGRPNSPFGLEIMNDFELGQEYDGPCPPQGYAPETHKYIFTVYALSAPLEVQNDLVNFPANAETLEHAITRAAQQGQILGQASIVTPYSSTPPSN